MIRFKATLESKLGRCTRCMRLTALLIVLSWAVLIALMQMERPITTWLIIATLVAVVFSLLGVAHAAAFFARHIQLLMLKPKTDQNTVGAAVVGPAQRDCGCGSSNKLTSFGKRKADESEA